MQFEYGALKDTTQQMLTIGVAVLVFSVSIFEKVYEPKVMGPVPKFLLGASWCILLTCIGICLHAVHSLVFASQWIPVSAENFHNEMFRTGLEVAVSTGLFFCPLSALAAIAIIGLVGGRLKSN